jgi:hypothetical protein
VSIQVNATNPNIGFGLGDGRANGGAIYGPGGPRDDTAGIFRLSNGEHVLTAADVQAMGGQRSVYQFRSSLHGFADGGAVSPRYKAAPRGYASGGAVSVSPQFQVVLSSKGGIDLTQYIKATIVAADSRAVSTSDAGWRRDV